MDKLTARASRKNDVGLFQNAFKMKGELEAKVKNLEELEGTLKEKEALAGSL